MAQEARAWAEPGAGTTVVATRTGPIDGAGDERAADPSVIGRDDCTIDHGCAPHRPRRHLRNASSRPYDGAIAAARTCYSPRVIGRTR